MKTLNKYFNLLSFILLTVSLFCTLSGCDDDIVPKTKPDYDPNDTGSITIVNNVINIEGNKTDSLFVFSSTMDWTLTVEDSSGETGEDGESLIDWISLDRYSGEAGEDITINMTLSPNPSVYDVRTASITIVAGNNQAVVTINQNYSVRIMDPSDIEDYDKYYTPSPGNDGFRNGPEGMLRSDAKYSWFRHRQSEHFVVFWEPGFGDNPNAETVPENLRVDIDDLLDKAEQFYKTNIEILKFAEVGQDQSYLDKYKMQIYLLYQEEWLATGSGYDNVIGALWVNPSTCKPVGSTIAHEIGHSFQYQVYCDKLLNGAPDDTFQGFRYGFAADGSGGNSFWEQCAQWQSFQDYPNELFGSHLSVFKANSHRHFNHEWMRYASYWLQYYWAQKHDISVVGEIWKQSYFPEDPLMTYQRLYCGGSLDKLYEELYDFSTRMVTFDIDLVRNYRTEAAQKNHSTKMYETGSGYYQVGYASAPGTTGYNIIPLNLPEEGDNTIKVTFEGLAPGSSLADADPGNQVNGDGATVANVRNYNASNNTDSGWRYGFVSVVNGVAQYSPMYKEKTATVSYAVPTGTTDLYMVVMGAPGTYETHPWNDDESDDLQWPYKVKFEGTDLLGSFYVDETADPQDITLTYEVDCDVNSAEFVLGSVNLALNQRLAQAFAMKPATMETLLLEVGSQPEEGKIAIALLQPDGTYEYAGNANNGFWCDANGYKDGYANGGVYFEFAGLTLNYGHRPGMTVDTGTKVVLKPVFIYTKNGTQYKATIELNMQF